MGSVVGRDAELDAIAAFLDPDGSQRVLVVEGEAGIGKTTIWAEGVAVAAAQGYRVLMARPVEVESSLAFAAAGDLLSAGVVDDVAARLPAPQRRALETALVLAEPDDRPLEPQAIAFAFLSALRSLADSRPTLVAVDDVQWLDPPSAAMLLYAARRLGDEPIRLLLARRSGAHATASRDEWALDRQGHVRVVLGPLSLGAIQRILTQQVGAGLSRSTLHRVHAVSGGNAFHALELGRALARRGAAVATGEPLPIPEALDLLVGERLALLPPGTSDALQVAALCSAPTIALLETAMGGPVDLAPAASAGVVVLEDGRLSFSHPLISEAISAHMTAERRREIHRRLAAVVPTLEQRARHLAVATERPSDRVATVLEQAALQAQQRGASRIAAELLDDAIRLTPARAVLARRARLLASSRAWHSALDLERAAALASEALELSRHPAERAEALFDLATCLQDPMDMAELALVEAGTDATLQTRLWTLVANRQVNVDAAKGLEAARRAVDIAERAGDDGLLALALAALGLTETVRCEGTPREHLERGIELERGVGLLPLQDSPSLALAVHAALHDDFDEARERLESLLQAATARGDERSQAHVLRQLARVEFRAGRWQLAARHATDSAELYEGSGDALEAAAALFLQATIAACRGDVDLVRARCRTARALTGDTPLSQRQERSAMGLLLLAQRKYDEAASALEQDFGGQIEPGLRISVPDRIEALIGAGLLADAEQHLVEWEELGRQLDRPRALATGARCRGLLLSAQGETEKALDALATALAEHDRLAAPFERARTLLALGLVQRRAKHRANARRSLEQARLGFDQVGAAMWADRARSELARVGGRPPSTGELTPAEQRIAELVAEGKKNREVATSLFVTESTVEAALTRVYRKLGIRSRTELARLLGGQGSKL